MPGDAYPIGADEQPKDVDVTAEEELPPSTAPVKVELPPSIGWKDALRKGWREVPPAQFYMREVLLGVIICMAQVPESIAFAYLARVRPPVALHAAWVIGLVCALLGGRPGMINGATGAFAAIVATFLEEPTVAGGNGAGVELLFPSRMKLFSLCPKFHKE